MIDNFILCFYIEYVNCKTERMSITMKIITDKIINKFKLYLYEEEKSSIKDEGQKSSSKINSKVNINTATQTELETLPGIGPSLALKIINYRKENGKFSNIEEIKNVSGIGDSKYEKLKNYILI